MINPQELKGKSTVELKAIAFDLQEVINQYTSLLQAVKAEVGKRGLEEMAKRATEKPPNLTE